MNDNIETDQIIPKQYLKRFENWVWEVFIFDEWRYDISRQETLISRLMHKKEKEPYINHR
ncbi:hypothetical protein CW304_14930 [Bacillus sp. UFRGS-B20]|nr:hypothetical protein CW304_14930 [Bacillus sp. UFRGS-B20]